VGRPRANPRPRRRSPEQEILEAAARLFAKQGFAATSTREIAARAGLRQASLFHYFPRKEAILGAVLDRAIDPALARLDALAVAPGSPALRLYRLLHFDVRELRSSPFSVGVLGLLAETRSPAFRRFLRKRERLVVGIEALIRAGVEAGELVAGDPARAAEALLGLDESTLHWSPRERASPSEVADFVASLALRALLADPSALDGIRRDAARAADARALAPNSIG
jgi:AcrR family transcriptional regulator